MLGVWANPLAADGEAGPQPEAGDSCGPGAATPTFACGWRLARREAVHWQPSVHSAEGQTVRSPGQLEVAHLDVADPVGVEVHLGYLREDEIQELARSRRPIWASKSNFSMSSRVSASKAAIRARRLPATWPGSARMGRRFRREVL